MKVTHLESQCVVSDEDCGRNLKLALARGLPICKEMPAREDKVAIVAAGPSVPDFLEDIRKFTNIWAINGAYNYLRSVGIVPNGFVGVDPLPGLAAYVKGADPSTTFYLSGLCDDAVFETLKDNKVELWFPYQDAVPTLKDFPLIQGGTTAVTRAPFVAKFLGFRDMTVFGVDSSFKVHKYISPNELIISRYCYPDGTFADDSKAQLVNPVICNGEGPFYTEECLLKQISQLGVMVSHQTWDVDFKIRCGGLMAAYMRAPMETDAFAA